MRLVVADTGSLNYLVLIDEIELLPRLFEMVFTPTTVREELLHANAPAAVRAWAARPLEWLKVQASPPMADTASLQALDEGERDALALAQSLEAQLVLLDDRAAVVVARRMGFAVTGTVGVLDLAARRGLVDIAVAVDRLKATTFRYSPAILDTILARHGKRCD